MTKEYYEGFEVIVIPAVPEVEKASFTYTESPWITIDDRITGAYYQYNRETGECRDVPPDWWK